MSEVRRGFMEMMLMQLYDSGYIFLISDRLTSSLIKVRWVLPSLLHLTYFEVSRADAAVSHSQMKISNYLLLAAFIIMLSILWGK